MSGSKDFFYSKYLRKEDCFCYLTNIKLPSFLHLMCNRFILKNIEEEKDQRTGSVSCFEIRVII